MRVVKVARDGAVGSPRQHSEYRDSLRLLRIMCLGANCIMLTYTVLLLYGTFSEAGRGSPLLFYSVLHGAAPGVWISYNMQVSAAVAATSNTANSVSTVVTCCSMSPQLALYCDHC
jgi:hypothetical protein